MTEHTPEQWSYDAKSRSVVSANGKIVAPHPHRDQGGAAVDAAGYLIAAAPDLLAACEAALDAMMREDFGTITLAPQLRAAISRARGEAADDTTR